MHAAILKVDLAGMVAAGTAERILDERPLAPVPWPNFRRAQCAVYLARYESARELLQDALKHARADGRPNYADVIEQVQFYLTKLTVNPDALRQDLIEIMKYNWSHFKVVSAA